MTVDARQQWYDWSLADCKGDPVRAERGAQAALQAFAEGLDTDQATRAARRAMVATGDDIRRRNQAKADAKQAGVQAQRQAAAEAGATRLAWRQAKAAELQTTSPLPLDPADHILPGGLTLHDDEFLVSVGRDWGVSSQRLLLTTHRIIHTHGRLAKDQQALYLSDVRDVAFKKPAIGYGTLVIESAGGHSLEGLPTMKNGAQVRNELLAMVHWVRQRAQQPQVVQAAPAEASPDIPDQLRKLGELTDAGILTEEEFSSKKAELLARL